MNHFSKKLFIYKKINLNMNLSEIKKEIKSLFVNLKEELSSEIVLNSVKTKDDQILSFENELIVGTPVFIINEDATQIPAPDAEYILEDDIKVIVKDGIVTEITKNEPVEETPVETPEVSAEEVKAVEEVPAPVDNMEERLIKIENTIAKLIEIVNTLTENISEEEMKSEVKLSMQNSKETKKEIKEVNERALTSAQIVMRKLYNS